MGSLADPAARHRGRGSPAIPWGNPHLIPRGTPLRAWPSQTAADRHRPASSESMRLGTVQRSVLVQ